MTDNIPMLMAVQVFGVFLFLYASFEKHRQRSPKATAEQRPVSPSWKPPRPTLSQQTLTAEERHELFRVANWLTVHNRLDSAATLRGLLERTK